MSHGGRRLMVALAVWAVVSVCASWLLGSAPIPGLALAAIGGLAFGVLGARRSDPRRMRVRTGRRRRRPRTEEQGT